MALYFWIKIIINKINNWARDHVSHHIWRRYIDLDYCINVSTKYIYLHIQGSRRQQITCNQCTLLNVFLTIHNSYMYNDVHTFVIRECYHFRSVQVCLQYSALNIFQSFKHCKNDTMQIYKIIHVHCVVIAGCFQKQYVVNACVQP